MSPQQVLDKRLESPLCVTVQARLRNWLSEVSYQEKKTLASVCGHLMKANKRTRMHTHTRSHCLLLPNNKICSHITFLVLHIFLNHCV